MDKSPDPHQSLREAATGSNNALFTMRDQIAAALVGAPIKAFRNFLHDAPVNRFLIVTDYCFHQSYPNDAIVFTVVKGGELLPTSSELAALVADLKKVRDLDDAATAFLRDPRLFTFAFVLEKKATLHASREAAIESMETSIKLQTAWENAETHAESIKRFKLLREEARAKRFDYLLYDRMLISSTLAAAISTFLLEHNPLAIDAVGWFSDRDAIVEKGTALASHFYNTSLHDYSVAHGLPEIPTVGVIDHANPQSAGTNAWFDPLIRIADYFAGPLAMIDYSASVPGHNVTGPSAKYNTLLSAVFSDNPNLVVIRLLGKNAPYETSLVTFSKTPPDQSPQGTP